MVKAFVGSIIRDEHTAYRIIYDYETERLKLLNMAYETMKWSVPRKYLKSAEPIQEWELCMLYGGLQSCTVSHITDEHGKLLFPKDKTYKVGDRFASVCGETYILAAIAATKAVLINLRTGWRYTDGFDVNNLQSISEYNIPAGWISIKEQ